jgi:sn-glycerol 3-phosphate transport system ATP-binding protein
VAQTPVCLMDEPLSNLEAQLRAEMRREIRALQRRLGITMIYVTHDQVEAMTMADQVILMRAGHVEQSGPPAQLYEHPATIFAARFIGAPAMSVVAAARLNGHATLAATAPHGYALDQLALGLRPESIRLDPDGLPAEVVAADYLGADTQVECRLEDEPIVLRLPGRHHAAPGERIGLAWTPADAHWFDLSSQRRVA